MPEARKTLLPTLIVTELCNADDEGAVRIDLAKPVTLSNGAALTCYHMRPKRADGADMDAERIDGKARWMPHRFNLFPLVLDGNGVPWAEATVYLMNKLENRVTPPNMRTYAGAADDLAAFRRFLDEKGLDWTHFPEFKLHRPTYRYRAYLKSAIYAGEISVSTAARRMGSIIRFYRWLKKKKLLKPANPTWEARDVYIEIERPYGPSTILTVETTDVSIRGRKKKADPYDGTIEDGGKLRPLQREEQGWLLDALASIRNTEMTLIHLMGVWTGGRLQTLLTFRVRHVWDEPSGLEPWDEELIPVGPGTGIDTKHDKQMVLHMPVWLYNMLRTYAHSERACHRREKAPGGDTVDQYLFLSVRGSPLYHSKEDANAFDASNTRRHPKTGQAVGQFIRDYVVPFIQAKYQPRFHYKFHDTRATYGMNLTDARLDLVAQGKTTLSEARHFVQTRMGHDSSATTDRYLKYRDNLKLARQANLEYADHLKALAESAMKGLL